MGAGEIQLQEKRVLLSAVNDHNQEELDQVNALTPKQSTIFQESKKIWKVALPAVLSGVASFGTLVVTQSFVGHISELELAGYALVHNMSVRFITGILIGMSSATETLCGQAFGAGQFHMMGIYLQRSWIVNFFALSLFLPCFIFGTSLFRFLGEEEKVAQSAGYASLWFIPLIYSYVFCWTNLNFLQAQQKNTIIAWLSISQLLIHVPLSWLLVYTLNWGTAGGILALGISSWLVVIGEFVYICGGWCPDSWTGFQMAAFKDIWPVVKLSVSSGVMLFLELWYNSVLVLLAGYMKNAEVAISAFANCLSINGWELTISLGFFGAACVRVANELGRGDARAAEFSIKVLFSTSFLIGVFFWAVCLMFGNKIGYLFSNEKEVIDGVSELSVLLAFSILFNGIYLVLSGVAVGAGLQNSVAIINLCCYYLIGIPIGILLGYLIDLQVKGIWIGMLCGVVTQSFALSFMTWRTDWDLEVSKAKQRLKRWELKSPGDDESNQSFDHTNSEMVTLKSTLS
ncbi:OLC1v1025466C1 [Oldenlandia corymbosa var. corymbosa]|uniref:Protein DETOXIFICATION n=1 Tax=Oldenlandia corymbosa var. corymbosa TaxID=529605 RepID=A0AAV1C4X2_OLDCO|nr:OLC1v1025466C1 [Oldenlandia corymbosa var. corymbosa]